MLRLLTAVSTLQLLLNPQNPRHVVHASRCNGSKLKDDWCAGDDDFATQPGPSKPPGGTDAATASTSSAAFTSPQKPWQKFINPQDTLLGAAQQAERPSTPRIYYATRTHSQIAQVHRYLAYLLQASRTPVRAACFH
jgi:hypothetical protein